MKKAIVLILAVFQIVKADPIRLPQAVNINPRNGFPTNPEQASPNVPPVNPFLSPTNIPDAVTTSDGESGVNLPQQALVILISGPCRPELNSEGKTDGYIATPLGVIPVNLGEIVLRNQLMNNLKQIVPQDEQSSNAEKGADLLGGGLLSSGSLGSALGLGGIAGESGSNLFQGGSFPSGGLSNGLLGNLINTGVPGNGILGLTPLNPSGLLSGLNLGNLGSNGGILGIFNLGSGTKPWSNILSKPSGTGLFGTNFLSGLNLGNINPLMGLGNLGITNPLTNILSNLGIGSGTGSNSNTGGLAGILGSMGIGGGIPAGPAGGLPGLLANLGIMNTIGNTNMFGNSVTNGLLGLLNNVLGGNAAGRMAGNYKRFYYARKADLKEDVNDMPWLVSILVDGVAVADGVLISNQHVLTAATPFLSVEDSSVLVTLKQGDKCSEELKAFNMTIKEILGHPFYHPISKAHDLALLKLSSKLAVSPQLLPICLPALFTPYIVHEVTVASYNGNPSSGPSCKPREIRLPLQSADTCSKAISPDTLVTEDKACLGVQGSKDVMCGAEVGTAVQYRSDDGTFELMGIMSHTKVCGSSNSTMFVKVLDHLPWILENTKDSELCIKI